jgi:hypothetical protein
MARNFLLRTMPNSPGEIASLQVESKRELTGEGGESVANAGG